MRPKNPIEYGREERALNKAKKQVKRSKAERKPRQRDWLQQDNDALAAGGMERIMPRGESERRKTVQTLAQQTLSVITAGDDDNDTPLHSANARIVEVGSGIYRVLHDGETLLCSARGALRETLLTVGDAVAVTPTGSGQGVIEALAPRRSVITRPDPAGHGTLLLAANIDQLLIVQAWRNPYIWHELIDRYLITAERNDITPLICVNKVDLADDHAALEAEMQPYRDLGYSVLLTSAEQNIGIDALRAQLEGKTSVVAGLSGVGKSSLLSAVQPGFTLKAGEVNEERGQGRHTTTQSLMVPFGDDGYLIDTPGIREFGLAGMSAHALEAYYPEFLPHAVNCRYHNCTHRHEPDCAVQAALAAGKLSQIRYHSYKVIFDSLST